MNRLMSTRDAAAALGVTVDTVRRWVRQRKITPQGRTPGGHWRFTSEQVAQVIGGPAEPERAHTDEARRHAAARARVRAMRRSA